MNIKVDRDLFLSELYYLHGVAGAKQLIPILSHLLIDAVPGKITMRATDLDVTVTTECAAVARECGSICHAVGQEGSHYALHGVKLEVSDERIRMVATDGHRLALVEREGRFGKAMDVIIPKRALVELAKICAASDETLLIGKDGNHIRFTLGKREIVSCLLAGRYPDYSAALPKGRKITAGFNATYLSDIFNALDKDEILFQIRNGETSAQFTVNASDQDHCVMVVMDADESRLDIRRLWWKPGEQIQLANGRPQIFYNAGQWGLGTEQEPPAEWREINNHVVFAFSDPNNWGAENVDFTVGGADPQDFYQTDAWGGFDPKNDQGRSYQEMSESYRESCEREIRNLIGNAVPKNFSWNDLLKFVPDGEQIIAVTPEYCSDRRRSQQPMVSTTPRLPERAWRFGIRAT